MRRGNRKFILSLFLLILVGCATTDGEGRYRVATIGNAKRSVEAVVISSQPVHVKSETSGAGRALGGATGGAIALNNSDNVGVIIAGIIGGAIIGNVIEESANIHAATEYVLKTVTNAIFTVVQVNKSNPIFYSGDKVILVYGYPSRLIADPR